MLGAYSSRFNYPGKIPAGLDLPVADKLVEDTHSHKN
jgi:hypothetical protein